jgi:hypothetical protein
MNPKPIEEARDQDLAHSFAALRRAAQRAREVAAQTGTDLIVWRNGKIEHIPMPEAKPAPWPESP